MDPSNPMAEPDCKHRGWKERCEVPNYTAEGTKAVFKEVPMLQQNLSDHGHEEKCPATDNKLAKCHA